MMSDYLEFSNKGEVPVNAFKLLGASSKRGDDTKIGYFGTGLKLQPNFVAWMMGFPLNWADLNYPSPNTGRSNSKRTATQSSRKSQSK